MPKAKPFAEVDGPPVPCCHEILSCGVEPGTAKWRGSWTTVRPSGYRPDESPGRSPWPMQPPDRCTTQCWSRQRRVPRNLTAPPPLTVRPPQPTARIEVGHCHGRRRPSFRGTVAPRLCGGSAQSGSSIRTLLVKSFQECVQSVGEGLLALGDRKLGQVGPDEGEASRIRHQRAQVTGPRGAWIVP